MNENYTVRQLVEKLLNMDQQAPVLVADEELGEMRHVVCVFQQDGEVYLKLE